MEPEVIADYACEVGENPMWHPLEKRLYWTDITGGRLFKYDPATGQHEICYEGEVVGGFTVQADGALLLFMELGAVAVLREGKLDYVVERIPGEEENRFNDVIADPAGRVFCGTIPLKSGRAMEGERLGRLFRLDTDGTVTPVVDRLGIANGMGFTPDRRQMYFTDSPDGEIYLFDYDEATGGISNRRVFVESPGSPDGLTVDAEGYVWSARSDGWSLDRFTPEGVLERSVRFPARVVSSLIFGGPDMTDIYVTTIGGNARTPEDPLAGATFRVNLGIKGVPEFLSRVGL